MHANQREEIKKRMQGEIVAVVGFKDTIAGDTVCDQSILLFLKNFISDPVISLAIEPKLKMIRRKWDTRFNVSLKKILPLRLNQIRRQTRPLSGAWENCILRY